MQRAPPTRSPGAAVVDRPPDRGYFGQIVEVAPPASGRSRGMLPCLVTSTLARLPPQTGRHEMSGAGPELKRALNQRQLTMIAMGGVIGAGLFVGSGVVINEAGPGAFLSYAITGVVIILVMRMLGEMATANPSTGSFADYARKALGGWAGFSVAWLYWYFWVIVVGFEAVAGAKIITFWFDAPLWLLSLGLMVLMTATNLVSVRSYGEFEYWFAGIKVFAIM